MQNALPVSFEEATGNIPYNMTNDYMFRYILQNNEKVLRGLICSLLHLEPHQIQTVKITNPINLNANIQDKEFILDISILLNDDTMLNLEMQLIDYHNWTDRSLVYLCRAFDQLYRGQKYEEALPVIHIGFLDYTLFPEVPEFYATNVMMNVKNHHVYSDKFRLSVVDLSQIELATEEDKAYNIDYWARLFKAKTWEEIKMVTKNNEFLQEAAQSIYIANADEIVRQQCLAREDAERHERTVERDKKRMQAQIDTLTDDNSSLKKDNTSLKKDNASLKKNNASLKDDITSLKDDNASLKDNIAQLQARIAELEAQQNK